MFLKLSAAILGGFPGARLFGGTTDDPATGGKLTNWAGNHRYGTDNLHDLTSVEEVRAFVKNHDALKVLGKRHCFNGIADSNRDLISLKAMDRVVALDPKARTVTVEGGMTYAQLNPYLQEKGFALHNLAALPHITIVGACATATHGSGVKNGNLATAVSALEFVTATGETLTLSREKDGDTFLGAVVNLGAIGVVTKVTLDIEPTFMIRQDAYGSLPLQQLTDHYEDIVSSGHSVNLLTNWQNKRVNTVWVYRRVEKADAPDAEPEFYGAKLARQGVPGPWHERLTIYGLGLNPSRGRVTQLQSEYFVSQKDAVEAILAVEGLRDHIGPQLMIGELRSVAADRLWLSPSYVRPTLAFQFIWRPDWESVRKVLPMIEKELSPFMVRPHWGKLFTMDPATLQSRYEKLADFKALLKEHDPHGKFQNEFLKRTLYG